MIDPPNPNVGALGSKSGRFLRRPSTKPHRPGHTNRRSHRPDIRVLTRQRHLDLHVRKSPPPLNNFRTMCITMCVWINVPIAKHRTNPLSPQHRALQGRSMGESRKGSLPICDRCLHYVVRAEGLATCEPCRKLWQLQVSLRGVLGPRRDEEAVIYLQECFTLLEEWIAKVKELEAAEDTGDHRARAARDRSPLKRKEEPKENRPAPAPDRTAPPVQPKAPPVSPLPRPDSALSVEGREVSKITSQSRLVPRPSQPPSSARRGRSPSLGLFAKKKAEPKKEVEPPATAAEEKPPRELKDTPKSKEEKKEKKRRTSSTSSSRRRRRREKRKREKEKRDKKRRRRSSSLGSSVSGSRVRAAKKKELKKLPTPPRARSPHTPPGPPPEPPPAPARDDSPPPIARGRGRGWIGPIPWSNHPRWYTGKNKGITRRAKQEKYNNRWW